MLSSCLALSMDFKTSSKPKEDDSLFKELKSKSNSDVLSIIFSERLIYNRLFSLIFSTSSILEETPIPIKIKTMIKKEISVTKTDFKTLLRNLTMLYVFVI